MSQLEIKILRELIREARAEPTPEVDWDRVERQLLQKIESDAPAPLPQPARWHTLAFVAAAAAVALAGAGVVRHYDTPRAPVAEVEPAHHVFGPGVSQLAGSQLAVGDSVVSGSHAIRVEHAGRAVWTLAPHSRATLAVAGRYLTVRLVSGSVSAEVVPSSHPESFAVEVEQTRIAVHGTRFVVERTGKQVEVTLERGVVAIGPASERGHTHGFLMHAPATGSFSLDGARTGHVEQSTPSNVKPTAPELPAAGSPAPAIRAPARAAPAEIANSKTAEPDLTAPATPAEPPSTAPLPERPAQSDLDRGAEQVAATVRGCFADHTEPETGIRVSAHSKLSIDVTPGGDITALHFNPPLAPPVQRCSAVVLRSVHFPASRRGASVTRTLILER